MRIWIPAVVGLTVVAVGAGAFAWSFGARQSLGDESHGAIAACEAGFVRSLASPSSYKRVKAEFTAAGPLTAGEYRAYQETVGCPVLDTPGLKTAGCIDGNMYALAYGGLKRLGKLDARKLTQRERDTATDAYVRELYDRYRKLPAQAQATAYVEIEYDASNAFGALIRSTTICRFGPRTRDQYSAGDMFNSQGH